MQNIKNRVSLFEQELALVRRDFYSSIADTSIPLIERLLFFESAPNYLKNNYEHIFLLQQNCPLTYSYVDKHRQTHDYKRYMTYDSNYFLDELLLVLETIKNSSLDETLSADQYEQIFKNQVTLSYIEFNEMVLIAREILEKNFGSFTLDW